MAAVVAPVGIEDAQFGLVGIAPLRAEVLHHLAQVVGIHGQPHALAAGLQIGLLHRGEALEHGHGQHLGLLHVAELREVLLARLDGVDAVAADLRELLLRHAVVEDEQLRRADAHVGRGVDQPHAVDGRGGALVELAGQELHGQELAALEVAAVGDRVGHHLAEDAVAAPLEQLLAEAEEVVDAQQAQTRDRKVEIGVQLAAQTLGLDLETRQLLDENTVVLHFISVTIRQIGRPTRPRTPGRSSPRR